MTAILDLETRRKIYDLIEQNPGINLSRIAELLHQRIQLVDYHLNYMEQHELITIAKEKGYKRCYVRGTVGIIDKRILALLRQDIPLQIVIFLLKHPFSRHRDIMHYLGMSSPRFSYYLKKLVKNDIITEATRGIERGYVVINEKEVIAVLIRYKPTTIAKMIKDTWEDFTPG